VAPRALKNGARQCPHSLEEALALFESRKAARQWLGPLHSAYLQLKRSEMQVLAR